MANEQNLKPFLPGNNANPKGRPKGARSRSTYLREILDTKMKGVNPITGKEQKMPVEKILDFALLSIALSKTASEGARLKALEMVKEQIYGKLPQDLNLGGQDDNPIIVEEKVSSLTTLERMIVKYGVDSDQVTKYQNKYCTSEKGDPETEEDGEK